MRFIVTGLGIVGLGTASSRADYYSAVLALNPVGFWQLNETNGTTAFDASGNGNNGTYQAGVTLGVAGVPNPPFVGFAANSLAAGFSSSVNDSWVTLTNLPINSDTVTITEWIYPTVPTDLGTTFWNSGQNAGLSEAYNDNAALGYNWHGGDGNQWEYIAFTPPADQWSFVALVITSTNAVFYLGNAAGLASDINNDGNTAVNFTTGTTIGGDGNNDGTGLNGSLSEVAVFNYSLTPAQITQLYADSGGNKLPPIITAQPLSHNAYTNGTTGFSVTAVGAAPLSYQWWQGTSPLAGQTNAWLTLRDVQSSDAGGYSVVITNSYGAVTSAVATLTLAAMPVAYENTVLADNPIGYWPLDLNVDTNKNASGQYLAADISGNGNAGTYNNISQPNQVFGPSASVPNGVSFNGTSQFVDLSTGTNTAVLKIGGKITMEAWVQPAGSQAKNPADILAMGYDYKSALEDEISVANGDFVGGRDSGYYVTGTAATTNWTYVVCTYDGTQWNLYLNAALVGTTADPQGASPDDIPWAIGNGTSGGSGRYFKGNICQTALYTNGLTPGQVSAHYAMGLYGTTNLAPIIDTQPVSQRVVTNTMATFTVVATASPLSTYQWYSVIGGVTNAIAGATSATYATPPVQDGNTGNGYFVVVSNSVGSIASGVAVLTAGHMVTATGLLTADEYFGNYANAIAAFDTLYPTASALPAPNKVEYLNLFNDNADLPDYGGERICGWFAPQVTGNYVFFEASDDAAALWLSTNSSPANVYEIAQNQAWMWSPNGTDWTCSNTNSAEYAYFSTSEWRSDGFETNGGPSAFANLVGTWSAWPGLNTDGSIPLKGGQQYYIELDHWQGTGGQSAAVTYKLAGSPDPVPGAASLLTGNTILASVPDTLAPPRAVISDIRISGSNVVMTATNGLVNAAFNLLTSTNPSTPLAQWTVAATQRLDAAGNVSITNTLTAGSRQQFYLLQVATN
jgi:hypothetical protein